MRRSGGFTIVELMVTLTVGGLLTIAAIGMFLTVLGQSPVMKARNTLSTGLQNALNRINDDVRRSSNITTYNLVPDANAPTSLTGYENVPGPETDTNDQYYWRMGENRMLLNQTPLDSSANPIYDNVQYAVGEKNTIIYYVRNGALYRRVVAAPYPNNSISTAACAPRAAEGGCVSSDVKLLDNLKSSLGAAAFKVAYYDKNGNQIGYTINTSGSASPDYSGFPRTRSIGVTIELESGKLSNNQTVSLKNTMRMQFRSQLNVVPPTVVAPPYVPPTNGLGDPGLMAGPGGVYLFGSSVYGGDVYVKGKLGAQLGSTMGGISMWGVGNGVPINLNVGNVGCGTGASFPQPCGSSSPPITLSPFYASINGNVCAKDQLDSARIYPYGTATQGLIPGCVPPDVDLPVFDKAAFTSSMNNGTFPSTTATCPIGGSSVMQANRTYTGNMNHSIYCKVTISGSAYITGNFTVGQGTQMRVAESVGRVRPIIVANGRIKIDGTKIIPNSYGTTPYFISFLSADNACSSSPSCNSITSAMLKQTLDNYTSVQSPVSLNLGTVALGSSFYAYFGRANIGIYTSIGAVAGQAIDMDQAGVVVLDGSL